MGSREMIILKFQRKDAMTQRCSEKKKENLPLRLCSFCFFALKNLWKFC